MNAGAITDQLAAQIRSAADAHRPLRIRAGGSKDFYGNDPHGEILDPRALRGVIAYEPSELYLRAYAGTPLSEIESELQARGQILPFEPPRHTADATLGGCVVAGLAGPRRVTVGSAQGAVRDFVLGARLLDGRGHHLSFGGTVIKNVAGYDVSRLLAGSLGVLGVVTEIAIKIVPRPAQELSLRLAMPMQEALVNLCLWAGQPWPISASCWHAGVLTLRLSGARAAVQSARSRLGGEPMDDEAAAHFWQSLRDQQHAFFAGGPLWRLGVPANAPPQAPDEMLIEWGGAQRWWRTSASATMVRATAAEAGGHATLYRGGNRREDVFSPLSAAALAVHRRLRDVFDPAYIFDAGRLCRQLDDSAMRRAAHAD
jgi:glycolate oxidase FAD binding subunit